MMSPERVPAAIMTRGANVLFQEPSVHMSKLSSAVQDLAGANSSANEWVLNQFVRSQGGLWVGGRVTLSTTSLAFAPNAANRVMHTGVLELQIPLEEIAHVEVARAPVMLSFTMKIVAVQTTTGIVMKVRCFGAEELAGSIERACSSDA